MQLSSLYKAKTLVLTTICGAVISSSSLFAQVSGTKYTFKDIKKIDASPVRDQYRSGTCWSFSTSSFLESELIRMGKGNYELSVMFTVRKAYEEKAKRYVQMHGALSWGQGGEFHDVMRVLKEYGAMPKSEYPGKCEIQDKYKMNELEAVLKGMLDAVIRNPDGVLSPYWMEAVNGVLDAYLGKVPEKFTVGMKEYTAKSFAAFLGINPDDYVELTSVTNHPYYTQFVNEIPDNWHSDQIYNITLDDMKDLLGNAINQGFSIAWGADVSEPGFSFKKGIAVLPDVNWDTIARENRDSFLVNPMKQMVVSPEIRQHWLDNYATQDDHGMQITGIAEDQLGDRFFLIKNSWGSKLNDLKGYFYASESYILAKTTGMLVNKKSIPRALARKMGI